MSADVPYVIAREGEALQHVLLFTSSPEVRGLRLSYPDPDPRDWEYGVLRARHGRRVGRALYNRMNPRHQWRCMEQTLCQNCGQTAIDPATGRIWWLLADESGDNATEGWASAPPICRACVYPAISTCPHLRRHAALYSVGEAEPFAVLAHLYRPSRNLNAVLETKNVMIGLEEFQRLTHALALELRVKLTDLQRAPIP